MTVDDVYRVWPSNKEFERATNYSAAARRLWRKNGEIPLRAQLILMTLSEGKLTAEGKK